ncbi:MAG: glycosyltransferase family 4 protein [Pseudomonadota bacterium]
MRVVTLSANTSWYLYNFRASTLAALIENGYRVVCLSPEDDYSLRLQHEFGCEWRALKMHNFGQNPVADLQLVWQLSKQYRELRPVVALHYTIKNNVYGTWAARLGGIPAVNTVSGLGTSFIRPGVIGAVVRLLYRTSQPMAHRVFCQNEDDLELLVGSGLLSAAKVELIPGSGVDLKRFHPRLRSVSGGQFRLMYAGRMLEDKGLRELIAAIRRVNDPSVRCTLMLVGFADAANLSAITGEELAKWGSEPGIEWLGPRDDMEAMYANADCVVLPSYREGMPRSLLEAGAMGLPVIATDVPGCKNLITDGYNGLLCQARDSVSLEAAIRKMLAMLPQERAKMGDNGRAHVATHFDQERVVSATLRAVDSAQAQ